MGYTAPTKATLLFPSVASDNVADRRSVDAKSLPDLGHWHGARHSPDLADDRPSELCGRCVLPPKVGSMESFIGRILCGRFPFKMLRIDATRASPSTFMRRFMNVTGRLTMSQYTHHAGGVHARAFINGRSISIFGLCEWPYQAIISAIGRMILKPSNSLAGASIYDINAASPAKSVVVLAAISLKAISAPAGIAIASINRACFELFSHIRSLHDRVWSEPVRRANAGRVRQMFLTRNGEKKGAFYGV